MLSNWFNPPMCPSYDDGTLAIPIECCPCPWPDMCPNGWPPLPAHCVTGCEPGQNVECCECPTEEWCTVDKRNFYLPPWCADKPGLDAGTDGADGSTALCPVGTCVPNAPEGWRGPATFSTEFWTIEQQPCPDGSETLDGWNEPPALTCPTCSCSEPQSTCKFSSKWTISSHGCGDFDSGTPFGFSPPPNWDGSCDIADALPEGKLCNGIPCVAAVRVSAPTIERIDTSCTPTINYDEELTPKLHNSGSHEPFGRVCVGKQNAEGTTFCGENNQNVCLSIPTGALTCIVRDGDVACPASWSQKHVLYKQYDDERSCSECSCGPIEGTLCTVKYRIFEDALCSNEIGSYDIDGPGNDHCYSLPLGNAISGKSMEKVNHKLGACQSLGGEAVGEVKLEQPFTVCCLPDEI